MNSKSLQETIKQLGRAKPQQITLPSGVVITLHMYELKGSKIKPQDQLKALQGLPTIEWKDTADPENGD
jgi:hypothetical protein